jgi:hypothetical protein
VIEALNNRYDSEYAQFEDRVQAAVEEREKRIRELEEQVRT